MVTFDNAALETRETLVGETPVPVEEILVTLSWKAVALVVNKAFSFVIVAAVKLTVPWPLVNVKAERT